MKKRFGVELLVDCYLCDPKTMDDVSLGYTFLNGAVDILGVHQMCPPYVFMAPEGYDNSGGTSGWVGIIESGISFHASTLEDRFVSINYYTCSEITEKMKEDLITYAQETFHPGKIDVRFVTRGGILDA